MVMSSCLATACQLLHQTQWLQECQTEPPGGVAGMDRVSYEVLGNTLGNRSEDVVEPLPSKVFPFVFLIALLGIFMLVNLRRTLIVDIRLPWPSSTATGTSHSTRIGYMPCALHDFALCGRGRFAAQLNPLTAGLACSFWQCYNILHPPAV